jgi:rhodanese-related sulfurtransferase
MRVARILFSLAAALAALPGCRPSDPGSAPWRLVERQVRAAHPTVPPLSTDSLAAWLADPAAPPPLLLDVREPAEYAVSHLPGARQVDPRADAGRLAALLADEDRSRPVVVYCSVGARSAAVAERLQQAGFQDVQNLEGSLFRWANEDRPVERDGQIVTEVHPFDASWGRLLRSDRRAPLP